MKTILIFIIIIFTIQLYRLNSQSSIWSRTRVLVTADTDIQQFNGNSILGVSLIKLAPRSSSSQNIKNDTGSETNTKDVKDDIHVFNCPVSGCNCSVVRDLNHASSLHDKLPEDGDISKHPGPKRASSLGRRTRKNESKIRRSQNNENKSINVNAELEPSPESIGKLLDQPPCSHCKARLFPGEPVTFCCGSGRLSTILTVPPMPPPLLQEVYENRSFLDNIRTYNNNFALASLGVSEEREAGYSPNVKIHGKLHHFVGSLLPSTGTSPKYAQLYFYDSTHELQNRMSISSNMDEKLVQKIQNCFHECNPFVVALKNAAQLTDDSRELSIILKSDGRKVTSLPTTDDIAGVLHNQERGHLDVVFQTADGRITRINELHRSYDPLHYIILFPFGTDGYHLNIKDASNKVISAMSYYKFMLQVRDGTEKQNLLLHSRRLTQQYAIDQFVKMETSRLNWHRHNQKALRAEKYQGLVDSVNSSDHFAPGKRIILPPSFTGSPRWYIEAFNDAMTIVRKYGKPDLFITLTCNPQWPEIQDSLAPGEKADDRPDLCVRVFHQKMKLLIKLVTKNKILGRVIAFTCMKEDQKRGLPHCHMLLVMHKDNKPRRPEDVDKIISAEIPDKRKFPELHNIISQNMIHGPCGMINKDRLCMQGCKDKDHCSKGFPKPYNNHGTTLSDNSYPNYLRRDPAHGGQVIFRTIKGKEYTIDNRWVVPYSPKLSYAFNAHVNVEIVISVKAVKYLYKYITKGSDQILFGVQDGVLDEIKNFETGRYIGATEAFWRMYGFEILNRYPSVKKLALHLPDQQTVLFETEDIPDVIDNGPPVTTLTAYFELNKVDPSARNILYPDICQHYRFVGGKWTARKNRSSLQSTSDGPPSDTLGRIPIITLNPKQSELFYLRMLLHHVPGAKDYDDLKIVDGVTLETFQSACVKRGLLSDDNEVDEIMSEMAATTFGSQLRELFGTLLMHGAPVDPTGLWERHKDSLSEDIAHHNGRSAAPNVSDYAAALTEIQTFLHSLELDLTKHFGILIPNVTLSPMMPMEEVDYDIDFLAQQAIDNYTQMTDEQKNVYDRIIDSVKNHSGLCFALNAAGGTGKTFVLSTVLATLRSENKVTVASAISGIAAILLPTGRTAHSRLKVPIELDDFSTCNIPLNSRLADELRNASILIIDEITMAHRHVFEAIERSIRDIRDNDLTFGGITTVLAGDWRQILPVVKHGSKAEILGACLKQSPIWQKVTQLKLTKNMRLSPENNEEEIEFANYLLSIGNRTALPADPDDPEYLLVPEHFQLENNSLSGICDFAYDDLETKFDSREWLCGRSILSVTNDAAEKVNREMLLRFPGADNIRKSADVILDDELARYYPTEFLNSLNPSGMPPHILNLKVGSPIMLLRNLDAVRGHCNGTRYIITQCHQRVLEATVASGLNIGKRKLIPRIPITCTDKNLPFTFKRTQFPVKTCFAMTINKSQGQSLNKVGLYLDQDVFAHGQLYVAMSRVKSMRNLKIVYPTGSKGIIRNVVYKEVL